jgi:hypothetical protein
VPYAAHIICHPEEARLSAAKERDRRTCFSSFLSKPDFLATGDWQLIEFLAHSILTTAH